MSIHNLPNPPTSFVGRVHELAEIDTLLLNPACRLLTLVGAGGIGKTRLAIQAASDQLAHFAHGVGYVPLTPVASPNLIAHAIARALQLTFYGSEDLPVQITRYLREKHLLLVLDNFEHLLDGVGLLSDILYAAPHVKLLVTSRERLNVQEEWALPLEGLHFPETPSTVPLESYSAVELFIQRARQIRPDFSIAENAGSVTAICQAVEGMPLALELAASWLRAMTCREIPEQIKTSLAFLETPIRNMPERHRSLSAVFEQSWKLLSETEQSVLMRLSVFRGGFTRDAAKAVAGASLSMLARLADKSLIRLNDNGRYDLHELVRQYAADKLNEAKATRAAADSHLAYFLELAEQAEAHQFGCEQISWFDRLEIEIDNLRTALAWSQETETGLRLAAALGWFFTERSHWNEGFLWLERTLAANPDALSTLRAKALHTAGALGGFAGNEQARVYLEQATALARATDDRWNLAWALSHLVNAGIPDPDQAAAFQEESLALFRELDDVMGITHNLVRRSWRAFVQKDYAAVRASLEEAEIHARQAGDKIILGWITLNMGQLIWDQDQDLMHSKTLMDSSLSHFREARFQMGVNIAHIWLGMFELAQGNLVEAQKHSEVALLSLRDIEPGHPHLVSILVTLAGIASARRQFERSARLLGAIHHFDEHWARNNSDFNSALATAHAELREIAFAEEWAAGEALTREQAIAYALADTSALVETSPVESAPHTPHSPNLLSDRERDILRLVAAGHSNREIADQLFLALSTVKWYLSEIYGKLGVSSRTQAVAQARQANLL